MTTTAKDLRFNTNMLFELLSKGEEVTITYRGKPKAKLVPIKDEIKDKDNSLFGIWSDKNCSVDEEIRNLRRGRDFAI